MYMIRDTDTGNFYDIRIKDTATILDNEDKKLTKIPESAKEKPWADLWENKHDKNNKLLSASEKGELKVVLDLLDKKKYGTAVADINIKGEDGFTPLHFAASEGHIEVTMALVRMGAITDTVSLSLRTPIHVACIRGYTEIILILIQAKSNINLQDKDGNTPIHILSEGGWVEPLEICLNYNPDLTIRNIYGETPLEIAANVATRNVFLKVKKEIEALKQLKKKDLYTRTVIKNVILHNNRADMIKSLLFKGQKIDGIDPSLFKAPSPAKESKENKKNTIKSRRIKILEAAKEISNLKIEDLKFDNNDDKQSDKEMEEKINLEYFDIITMLGKGSFGEVYLVKYKPTNKLYAMKTLSKKRFMGQNLLRYAQAERNVLCYSNSPFIVGIDFAFQTGDKLFLILEYCPGYFY